MGEARDGPPLKRADDDADDANADADAVEGDTVIPTLASSGDDDSAGVVAVAAAATYAVSVDVSGPYRPFACACACERCRRSAARAVSSL
jgi:hypothetical protein